MSNPTKQKKTTTHRVRFERWAKGRGIDITRSNINRLRYAYAIADTAWNAWKEASRRRA